MSSTMPSASFDRNLIAEPNRLVDRDHHTRNEVCQSRLRGETKYQSEHRGGCQHRLGSIRRARVGQQHDHQRDKDDHRNRDPPQQAHAGAQHGLVSSGQTEHHALARAREHRVQRSTTTHQEHGEAQPQKLLGLPHQCDLTSWVTLLRVRRRARRSLRPGRPRRLPAPPQTTIARDMPRPASIAGAFATVALVIVAGGCGFKSEPTGAISPAPVTVTDASGTAISAATQVPTPDRLARSGHDRAAVRDRCGRLSGRPGAPATSVPAAAAAVPVVALEPRGVRRCKPDLVIADEHSAPGAARRPRRCPCTSSTAPPSPAPSATSWESACSPAAEPRVERWSTGCAPRSAAPGRATGRCSAGQGLPRPGRVRAARPARLAADRRRRAARRSPPLHPAS